MKVLIVNQEKCTGCRRCELACSFHHFQTYGTVADALVVCKFHQYINLGPDRYANLLSCATGWNIDGWKLLEIGDRIFNLARAFNVREGIRKRNDMLPPRIMQPATSGSTKGIGITNYEGMLSGFYKLEEWNEDGVPIPQKLNRLGLSDVAEHLAGLQSSIQGLSSTTTNTLKR